MEEFCNSLLYLTLALLLFTITISLIITLTNIFKKEIIETIKFFRNLNKATKTEKVEE